MRSRSAAELRPGRRRFLRAVLASALAPWLARPTSASAPAALFVDYPFRLGVGSGAAGSDRVVLWTRIAPDALHDGGMGVEQVRMQWEVATDEKFGNVVRHGDGYATAGRAHSAHVTVDGLDPDRWYWYRFAAGGEVSPVGRTRTLPAAGALPAHARFALASCQHFEYGYFSAYRHMLRDEPDFVCFVGDYIYESSLASGRVRTHAAAEPYTLAEYRARYAQYRLDADLQAMHAAVPWIMTIDDHEVVNDWAGDTGQDLDPNFVQRRANALQAYFEHTPLPMDALLANHRLALYRALDFGALARFHVLDDRQYRDPEVCPRPGMGGSRQVTDAACPDRKRSDRTMLGAAQERWLDHSFASSRAKWNVIVQQTLMSQLIEPMADGPTYWTDAWDGYPAARDRLVESMLRHDLANPVVIGGDYHCTFASNLKKDFSRADSPTVASEFVGTSITSAGMTPELLKKRMDASPHILYGDSRHRGYLLFDLRENGMDVAARTLDTVEKHDSEVTTRQEFRVESGMPGVILA